MAVRVIFMGTSEFAVPCLEALGQRRYDILAVYTQQDRGVGRGQQLTPPPVKRVALTWGLKVSQPATFKLSSVIDELAGLNPEVIVVAAFGHILPQEVLTLPRFGCVNVHPSLLPRYRGSSPVVTALLNGDEMTGVTIMLLDSRLDTGPILAQREVPISVEDTGGSLTTKLASEAAELLLATLPLWLEGEIKPQPQSEAEASYTKLITKKDGEIDWQLSALEIWRRVRAFNPWPGCYTWWEGKRLKINRALPLTGSTSQPGRVIALPISAATPLGVETGEGLLGLERLQLEGKREMSAAEFILGHRYFIGSTLVAQG